MKKTDRKEKIACSFHEDYLCYSGGSDTNPLPVCKNCGLIIYYEKQT